MSGMFNDELRAVVTVENSVVSKNIWTRLFEGREKAFCKL